MLAGSAQHLGLIVVLVRRRHAHMTEDRGGDPDDGPDELTASGLG